MSAEFEKFTKVLRNNGLVLLSIYLFLITIKIKADLKLFKSKFSFGRPLFGFVVKHILENFGVSSVLFWSVIKI